MAAVVAGDVAKAKSLYPAARIPYVRIEPVAESFGDLDPRIDARANVEAALKPYRHGDGFVSYTELTPADTRKLAQTINALAERMSETPAQVAGGAADQG